MRKINPEKYKHLVYIAVVIVVLILGAVLRLGFKDVLEFKSDEGGIAHDAFAPTLNHGVKALSYNRGLYSFATYSCLLSLLFFFFTDARIITILSVGIPNTIAVILCFFFGIKFFNRKIALISTSLFAFSMWSIIYSRKIWGVNLLQFYSLLMLFLVTWCVSKNKSKLILAVMFLLFFGIELHLSALSLFFISSLVFTIHFNKLRYKYLLLAAIIFGVILLPSLYFSNVNQIICMLAANLKEFSFKGIFTTLTLMTRDNVLYEYLGIPPLFGKLDFIISYLLRTLFLLGVMAIIEKTISYFKKKEDPVYFVISAWYGAYVVYFGFSGLPEQYHYFMLLFPVYFIIMAIGFTDLTESIMASKKDTVWKILVMCLVWQPIVTAVLIVLFIIMRPFPKRWSVYVLKKKYINIFLSSSLTFIIIFQSYSDFYILKYMDRTGGGRGQFEINLGAKIDAVKYIIQDAEKKYKVTGLSSSYTVFAGRGYAFLFESNGAKEHIISQGDTNRGFHYIIAEDINRALKWEDSKSIISKKYIGPVLVVVEQK